MSALDGQSVLDILFVTQDGQYISLSGKTGQQTIDTATRRKLAEGKMVSGYRMWNGEEAFLSWNRFDRLPFTTFIMMRLRWRIRREPSTVCSLLCLWWAGKYLRGGSDGTRGLYRRSCVEPAGHAFAI
ncbi:MAG: hypothetical protein ACLR4A_14175 [Christensenellales bacterium]